MSKKQVKEVRFDLVELNNQLEADVKDLKVKALEKQVPFIISKLKEKKGLNALNLSLEGMGLVFSAEAQTRINRYYTVKAHFCVVERSTRSYLKMLKARISKLEEVANPSDSQVAEISATEKEVEKYQLLLSNLRKRVLGEMATFEALVPASMWLAYRERFSNAEGYLGAIKEYLDNVGINVKNLGKVASTFSMVLGSKSTKSKHWDTVQVVDLQQKEFKALCCDLLLEIARENYVLSSKQIKTIIEEEKERIEISVPTFSKPKNIKDCQAILDDLAINYDSKWKRVDYDKALSQAEEKGLCVIA